MTRRATLSDVAQLAGVSMSTASKALNRRTGMSADTRRRVTDAMDSLGYVPITRDRGHTRSGAIVAVFDTLYTLYSVRVLEGLARGARNAGLDLLVEVSDPFHAGEAVPDLDEFRVKSMSDKGHVGVIMVTSRISDATLEHFRTYELPLVSVDASTALHDGVVNVSSTHWRGGMQAASHLLELGHRRIAFIGGDPGNPGVSERLAGFVDLLRRNHIDVDETLVDERGLELGHVGLEAMLCSDAPPTAVFASSDTAALAAIDVAKKAGLDVPRDLSVIGYDDAYALAVPAINLTTVHAPLEALGRSAVEHIVALAHGSSPEHSDIYLSTQLVVRGTTSTPRGPRRPSD